MTFDLANTDKLNVFRQDLDRLGIKLLPPDINRSQPKFSVEFPAGAERGAVRYALAAARGVGVAAMEAVVAERERNGPFKDLTDFARRMDTKQVNKRQLEALVKAGAFDALEPNRARAFAAIETMLRFARLGGRRARQQPEQPVRRRCRAAPDAAEHRRTGRCTRSCRTSSRRSGSISRRTRSMPMPRRSSGWAPSAPASFPAGSPPAARRA